MSGLAAGMMIVSSVLLCAAVGVGLGWLVGAIAPLGLVGAAVGLGLGFYAVWLRFFRGSQGIDGHG